MNITSIGNFFSTLAGALNAIAQNSNGSLGKASAYIGVAARGADVIGEGAAVIGDGLRLLHESGILKPPDPAHADDRFDAWVANYQHNANHIDRLSSLAQDRLAHHAQR